MGRGRYRVDEVGGDGGRVRGEVDGVVDGVIEGVVERVEGLIKDVEGVLGVWVVPYFVKQFLEGVLRELRVMRDELRGSGRVSGKGGGG